MNLSVHFDTITTDEKLQIFTLKIQETILTV